MRGLECLTFAARPDRIGGLTPALCFDGALINRIDDVAHGTSKARPGDPAREWNEAAIADTLQNPGGENLVIVNMEGLARINYLQSDAMIDKGIKDLAMWLGVVRRNRKPGARIALDLAEISPWALDAVWTNNRTDTANYWRRMRKIAALLRVDVLPLVDAVVVQCYYTIRWGDPQKDLFGEEAIWGNFRLWQTHACALSALTELPAIALFSPLAMSINPAIKDRPLNDWEMGQSMFYLSALGYSEVCFWGNVPQGPMTKDGFYFWNEKAEWLPRLLKYWNKDGNFVPDSGWPMKGVGSI